VGVSSQQNAQVELEENVAWLLKNITFPPEFYPENGICRPHLKKIQPIPFLKHLSKNCPWQKRRLLF